MKSRIKWLAQLLVFASIGFFVLAFALKLRPGIKTSNSANLIVFSPQELLAYDGTSPEKPVYLAMNGLVYDVTAGKEFYVTGGPYHDLAGRDASAQLNLFGGAIIKKKYPIIGILK